MRRRNTYPRRRKNTTGYRRRTVFMRPSVQITILLIAALVVFILLQSGGR